MYTIDITLCDGIDNKSRVFAVSIEKIYTKPSFSFFFFNKYPFLFNKREYSSLRLWRDFWKVRSETLLIVYAKTGENNGVRRNALSFHAMIFATTFKFHVGSVSLIDLISSVPSGRLVSVEDGVGVEGGGEEEGKWWQGWRARGHIATTSRALHSRFLITSFHYPIAVRRSLL